jgi:hypothetical protein
MSILIMTGCLMSGGCLPDNFWPGVWGNTVIDGTISAILANALTALGL